MKKTGIIPIHRTYINTETLAAGILWHLTKMELQETVPGPKDIRNLHISCLDQWIQKEFLSCTRTYLCTVEGGWCLLKNQTTTILSCFCSHHKIGTQDNIQNVMESVFHWDTDFGKNIENKKQKIFSLEVGQDLFLQVDLVSSGTRLSPHS